MNNCLNCEALALRGKSSVRSEDIELIRRRICCVGQSYWSGVNTESEFGRRTVSAETARLEVYCGLLGARFVQDALVRGGVLVPSVVLSELTETTDIMPLL